MTDSDRLKALYAEWKANNRNHTQAYAAKYMGITQSAVSQYLLGKIALNLDTLLKFANLFGCRPEEISPALAEAFYRTNPWRDDDPWQGMPGFESYLPAAIPIEIRGKLLAPADGALAYSSEDAILGYLDMNTHHASVYAIQIDGDGLAPLARNGWYLVVTPDAPPQPGDYVLVVRQDGHEQVLEYLFERGGTREFMMLADRGRVTLKADEDALLTTVAAIVSPSMFRAASSVRKKSS
ncbi:helix-turn-helix domain-containing protein [Achromobacter xylosoxidans]